MQRYDPRLPQLQRLGAVLRLAEDRRLPVRTPTRPLAGFSVLNDAPASSSVLLACAGDPLAPDAAVRLGCALALVSDWDALESSAVRHGMAALLYRRCVDRCPEAVPPDVLAGWRELMLAVAARSLRMQKRLLAFLERLSEARVPALALKGPAFSQQLYGDATLRHFIDLDVLVHPRDVTVAHRVALSAGYVDAHPFHAVSESRLQRGEQEIGLKHADSGVKLEIHWRMGPRFPADSLLADELFSRSGRLELLGREVSVLGRLDVLLVLAVHGANHGWHRIEDVAAFAAGLRELDSADGRGLERLATATGCRRRLHVGVLLAKVLAQTCAPSPLALAAAADHSAQNLAARAGARLLWAAEASSAARTTRGDAAREALWLARTLDTPGASARHLWNRLFAAGAKDWGDDSAEADGRWSVALRRQRRIWRR